MAFYPSSDPSISAVLLAARQAADVVCDRWSLLLILAACQGERRFSGFMQRTGIASRLLTGRLKVLQANGLMFSMPYSIRPLRHEYGLTRMGEALAGPLAQMMRWEANWPASTDASSLLSSRTRLALPHGLQCLSCRAVLTARDIRLKLSLTQLQRAPIPSTRHRRSIIDTAAPSATPQLIGPTLDIFGDKWGIEILLCAFFRIRRFNAFRKHTGIAANILADRLGRLSSAGVLVCGDDGGYRLTEKGVDLYGAIVAIQDWADGWLKDRYRSPILLVHAACGQVFHPATPGAKVVGLFAQRLR